MPADVELFALYRPWPQVVHIDFNVCFDKGRRLRVPECVPFRLTPNVAGALGTLGPGADFTQRCIEVMGVLREHKVCLV